MSAGVAPRFAAPTPWPSRMPPPSAAGVRSPDPLPRGHGGPLWASAAEWLARAISRTSPRRTRTVVFKACSEEYIRHRRLAGTLLLAALGVLPADPVGAEDCVRLGRPKLGVKYAFHFTDPTGTI